AITERKQRDGALKSPGGFLRTLLADGTARQEALARETPKQRPNGAPLRSGEEDQLAAWESHRRKVADEIEVAQGLDRDQVIALVQETLAGQPSAKVIRAALERNS